MKLCRVLLSAGLFQFLALALPSDGCAELILNGGFESPAVPTGSYTLVTPTSWNLISGPSVSIFRGNGGDSLFPLPQEGEQYLDLGNAPASLSQTFSVLSAGDYLLTWYDNTGDVPSTSPYTVEIFDSLSNIVSSQSLDAYHAGLDDWQLRSVTLSLTPGSYELVLSSAGFPGGLDTLIDDVSIEATAVPEPSSLALAGLGGIGLIVGAIRRRRAAAV